MDARIGTQGWNYPGWVGPLYPPGTRAADFLKLYARAFRTVEVDSTFYAIPAQRTVRGWAERTPAHFRFALKLPQEITHERRFRDSDDVAKLFFDRARELGEKLGPILVQFPPTRPRDDGFLRLFLDLLDRDLDYAFEFRHPSWDEAADILAEAGIARVGSLEEPMPFRYLRLREPPYEERDLAAWARRLRPLLARGIDVYVYFKHEDEPSGPRYAERLLALAAKESGAAPPPTS